MDRVSVIIPVYNTEPYLQRCIESICNQTYKELEIIVIDDGSTDGSLELLQRMGGEDPRIRVLSQENHGNNYSRKRGVNCSTGEFIMFLDSDDYVTVDCVSTLMQAITQEDDIQVVFSSVLRHEVTGKDEIINGGMPPGIYTDIIDRVQERFWKRENGKVINISPYLYSKIYRKAYLKKIMDLIPDNLTLGEDKALIWTMLIDNAKVSFIDDVTYHYCRRNGSIMTAVDKDFLGKINTLYNYFYPIIEKQTDELKKQFSLYTINFLKIAINWKMGLYNVDDKTIKFLDYHLLDISPLFEEKLNVVLYGAGRVGADYYEQLTHMKKIHIVAWVDKNKKGSLISSPDKIVGMSYDKVLVAVKERELFIEIQKELHNMGIDNNVIWLNSGLTVERIYNRLREE